MVAPKDESKSLVLDWLSQQGLANQASVSPRGNTILVKATVSEAEKLLETEYDSFGKSFLDL
jgi:tripeptidyl-peptidase I